MKYEKKKKKRKGTLHFYPQLLEVTVPHHFHAVLLELGVPWCSPRLGFNSTRPQTNGSGSVFRLIALALTTLVAMPMCISLVPDFGPRYIPWRKLRLQFVLCNGKVNTCFPTELGKLFRVRLVVGSLVIDFPSLPVSTMDHHDQLPTLLLGRLSELHVRQLRSDSCSFIGFHDQIMRDRPASANDFVLSNPVSMALEADLGDESVQSRSSGPCLERDFTTQDVWASIVLEREGAPQPIRNFVLASTNIAVWLCSPENAWSTDTKIDHVDQLPTARVLHCVLVLVRKPHTTVKKIFLQGPHTRQSSCETIPSAAARLF